MYTIGITGQIASGKSTVSRELGKLGAIVIDADRIGHELVANDRSVKSRLVKTFGKEILGRSGEIDRRALAKRAFQSEDNTEKLNRIVHPVLLKELRKQIAQARKSKGTKLIVVDAALIFDWGLHKELDAVIVVDSKRDKQLARLKKLGVSGGEKRIRRQIPKYRLRRMADAVIHNDGSEMQLTQKAWHLFARLVRHTGQKFD